MALIASALPLDERLEMLRGVVSVIPKIGKTALMKCVFLLQRVYKINLGYNFELYTYGPYSAEVMEDIDYAVQVGYIGMERYMLSGGSLGYRFSVPETISKSLVGTDYGNKIEQLAQHFPEYTAKEWEMAATIVFIYTLYIMNNWDLSDFLETIQNIKPHFSLNEIEEERAHLETIGFLCRDAVG
ncbi:MAG: hypothetical protein FWF85_05810 [Clostridiales bacterium]|nr:hypothetical protein [Clostridiales bacterium]